MRHKSIHSGTNVHMERGFIEVDSPGNQQILMEVVPLMRPAHRKSVLQTQKRSAEWETLVGRSPLFAEFHQIAHIERKSANCMDRLARINPDGAQASIDELQRVWHVGSC